MEPLYRRRVPFPLAEESTPSLVLPSDHFLHAPADGAVSPKPTWPIGNDDRGREGFWDAVEKIDISTLAAADYDVDVLTGFLPPTEPIRRLSELHGGEWEAFEIMLELGQGEVQAGGGVGRVGESWRESVRALEIPPMDKVTTVPVLRRAHVVLSFLGHLYIHSTFPALRSVPSSIAIPWVRVSDRLGLPAVLTYADTVLWNWRLVDPSLGITADNVTINTTFTLSPSENAFFLLSLLCELKGPPILRSMASTLDESFFSDTLSLPRISSHLTHISTLTTQLTSLLAQAMKGAFGVDGKEYIDPRVFYWDIRPWFNGGLWNYEGVDGGGRVMEWGGPSAGQSSLIHSIDLFLGIDHSPRPTTTPSPPTITPPSVSLSLSIPTPPSASSDSTPSPAKVQKITPKPIEQKLSSTFMHKASLYMPSHHRSFLLHLSSLSLFNPTTNPSPLPSIRSLAIRYPVEVGRAFDDAVGSMKRFRDEHMKIATRFIVSQARTEPDRTSVFWAEWDSKRIAKEREETVVEGKLKGTGGTELVEFLKSCRVRTVEALVGSSPSSSS